MHGFVRRVVRYHADMAGVDILEIGSRNVNGSVRNEFQSLKYLGIDLAPGPNVDRVCSTSNLIAEGYSFDTVICLEVLEHCERFWELLADIALLLRPDGVLYLSARGATKDGRATIEHNFPVDLWRFMPQSVPTLFNLAGCIPVRTYPDMEMPGFVGVGRRTGGVLGSSGSDCDSSRVRYSFIPDSDSLGQEA